MSSIATEQTPYNIGTETNPWYASQSAILTRISAKCLRPGYTVYVIGTSHMENEDFRFFAVARVNLQGTGLITGHEDPKLYIIDPNMDDVIKISTHDDSGYDDGDEGEYCQIYVEKERVPNMCDVQEQNILMIVYSTLAEYAQIGDFIPDYSIYDVMQVLHDEDGVDLDTGGGGLVTT